MHPSVRLGWPKGRLGLCASVLCVALLSAGCIERYMVIRSQPAGARVIIDDIEVGKTPIEKLPYVHTGYRRVVLELEGYERHIAVEDVSGPWYCHFPFDIVTELLIPHTFDLPHSVSCELKKREATDTDKLIVQAKALREKAQRTPARTSKGFSAGEKAVVVLEVCAIVAIIALAL